jgi:hypothetical protein
MTNQKLSLAAALVAAVILAGLLRAEGVFETSITIALPPVLPPRVVVQPGVQVVEDLDEEVFFSGGWNWARRGDLWYRARDYRARWICVEEKHQRHHGE